MIKQNMQIATKDKEIYSAHIQDNHQPDHPTILHNSKQIYESIIPLSFEIMEKLNVENPIKALVKIYIQKFILYYSISDASEHKLLVVTAILLAQEVQENNNCFSIKFAEDTLGQQFCDKKIIFVRNKLLLLLGEQKLFQTPYTYLNALFSFVPQMNSSILKELQDLIILSQVCFQLIDYGPKCVFLGCIKFMMESLQAVNAQMNQSVRSCEALMSKDVCEVACILGECLMVNP